MDGLTAKVYNGVKCYWRTRGYRRLNTSSNATHEEETTGRRQRSRRRRLWRIKINPSLKLKITTTPRKLLVRFQDAYVRIMMRLANTSVVRGRTMTGYNGDGFGKSMIKEYDERIIIEIYKSLASRQKHQDQISSSIAC